MKSALGIMTTDTQPKMAMEECSIGGSDIKIFGVAKGSGMIYPNMATTLGYIFTDATLSSSVLNDVLKNNIKTTFNAISCDGDTSTNDMVSIFSTSKVNHSEIKKYSDSKLKKNIVVSKFNFLENPSCLFEFYLELCKKLGLGNPISDKKPIYPYNILITNKWIAIIKRKKDHIHGFSINGLGFAGYLLVTENSNINYLKKLGPEKLLENFV